MSAIGPITRCEPTVAQTPGHNRCHQIVPIEGAPAAN
jgi:hypothetical protein